MSFDSFYEVRDQIASLLERDLVGPCRDEQVFDDEQLMSEPPITRYSAGILFPRSANRVDPEQDLDQTDDYDESARPDPPVAMANVKAPSSLGVTFAVDQSCAEIEVSFFAARYEREDVESERSEHLDTQRGPRRRRMGHVAQVWRRHEVRSVPLVVSTAVPVADQRKEIAPGLESFWRVRPMRQGTVSITVGIMNVNRTESFDERDEKSFFQCSLSVTGRDSTAPFVARHREESLADDEDLRSYKLLYRHSNEFATGHGCSTSWTTLDSDPARAVTIRSEHVPRYELLMADSNPSLVSEWFNMMRLASSSKDQTLIGLTTFCEDYRSWINELSEAAHDLTDELAVTAEDHIEGCSRALDRMLEGISLLGSDDLAWQAFNLANRAMAEQRARSELERQADVGELDLDSHEWRPFQLGFILQALCGIADSEHADRELADLLWFPTGGGKTEAYLGLIAFSTFLRRLRDPRNGGGVTVLMRYTLRLLTIQQFERATLLICVMESLRRADSTSLGGAEISIGLWIGSDGTPNDLKVTKASLEALRSGRAPDKSNPMQIHRCPWCGFRFNHRNYWIADVRRRLVISCKQPGCDFQDGLPVYVVDEDIYNYRPTLVIATADKYAGLPWRDRATELFNLDHPEPPPVLIIQDELHLIAGPLGTLAGLYETAIDALCRDEGDRPAKVVASTATIRRAKAQVAGLFARDVAQFPPPGLDSRDSWFAVERPRSEKGTRMYLGLLAPSTSQTSLMVRAYGLLLQKVSEIEADDNHKDPYWTLLGYFNSLRVLGGALLQVSDDVPGYMSVVARRDKFPLRKVDEIIELTSRVSSSVIPDHLKRMERSLGDPGVLDVILATNMISVGVDISRLGLMAVMGQPQSSSEYIQATSRVGRRYPGLVVVLFNSARSRDRSHYESFVAFHNALYRQVDSSSVTPFSARARDRALHAVLVALARLWVPELRPNNQAGNVAALEEHLPRIRDHILDRIQLVSPEEVSASRQQLDAIIENWIRRANEERKLVYQNHRDPDVALLVDANSVDADDDHFGTLWSLRDVDTETKLYLERNRTDA